MSKAQRVVFSFDERSLESLQRIREQGRFSPMGDAGNLYKLAEPCNHRQSKGFPSSSCRRNPQTGETRVLVIPNLQSSSK